MNENEAAAVAAGLGIFSLVYLAVAVLMIVSLWKIYTKVGLAGWKCLIPIYNVWELTRKVNGETNGQPEILHFLINLFVSPVLLYMLGKAFGKDTLFSIALIFFSPILLPVLAFSGAQYKGPQGLNF